MNINLIENLSNNTKLYVDISDSDGFRNVKNCDDDYGMLFKWSSSMVMNGVTIPLTAVFLDSELSIVDTIQMTPEPQNIVPATLYASEQPYSYVLEVKTSAFSSLNWKIGDKLKLSTTKFAQEFIPKALLNSVIIYGELDGQKWSGSGFLVSKEGHALTCSHVCTLNMEPPFDPRTKLTASFDGIDFFAMEIVAINYDLDVAIFKIPPENMPNIDGVPLSLGTTDVLFEGYPISVISAPEGVENIVTSGIISSDIRHVPDLPADVIFIDAEIAPGSSGGAVISDETGDVIGIARGSLFATDDANETEGEGVNYVISIDIVKVWLNNLGINIFTPDTIKSAYSYKLKVGDIVKLNAKGLNAVDDYKYPYVAETLSHNPEGYVNSFYKNSAIVSYEKFNILLDKDCFITIGKTNIDKLLKNADKYIVVSVGNKELQLIDDKFNKKLSCKVSTGAEGNPTYYGIYKITEKEENPYEPAFKQYLPFWLGFNPLHNIRKNSACIEGLHSIPLDENKVELDDPIGEANSHGCVRLSKENAAALYDVLNVGDVVVVRN